MKKALHNQKKRDEFHSQLNKVFTANPYDYITPEVHFPEASTGFNTNMSDTYKETMKDILLDLHFQGNRSDEVDVKADAAAMIDAVGTGVKMTVETSAASRGAPPKRIKFDSDFFVLHPNGEGPGQGVIATMYMKGKPLLTEDVVQGWYNQTPAMKRMVVTRIKARNNELTDNFRVYRPVPKVETAASEEDGAPETTPTKLICQDGDTYYFLNSKTKELEEVQPVNRAEKLATILADFVQSNSSV